MQTQQQAIESLATVMGLSEQELIKRSLFSFVLKQLQEVKIQLLTLQKRYNVQQVEDFDLLYEQGVIEEADTWEDVQKFDRLAYKQELYEGYLKSLM